ncbi:MAG: chemotaxis protein CheW [Ktedonobacterales bacterium]
MTSEDMRPTVTAAAETATAGAEAGADGGAPAERLVAPDYLFLTCAGVECAIPLSALREVLPARPEAVALPHSPEWLLGVFALRAELFGLADPAPLLLGQPGARSDAHASGAVMLVGSGERTLAWVVERLGATVPLLAGGPALTPRESAVGDGAAVVERYRAGEIVVAGGDQRYVVVLAQRLLDDMLGAIEERPATNG